MSTQYQSGKDVPTEVLAARLNELAHVVAQKRDRIGDEFTMRIPAECDRDADLVMSEAAVRLEALQAELAELKQTSLFAAGYRFGRDANDAGHTVRLQKEKDTLQAECDQLRKDAERYRWLREQCQKPVGGLTIATAGTWELGPWSGDDPDEAIDRARRFEKIEESSDDAH
jgi:hypothetical protein